VSLLAFTTVDLGQPWLCHVFMAVLFVVLLDRGRVKPKVSVPAAALMALGGVWFLQTVRLPDKRWFDAVVYWRQMFDGLDYTNLATDPQEFFVTLVGCWLIPPAAAFGAVRFRKWRKHEPSVPSDR
jgi:hypothetical protein